MVTNHVSKSWDDPPSKQVRFRVFLLIVDLLTKVVLKKSKHNPQMMVKNGDESHGIPIRKKSPTKQILIIVLFLVMVVGSFGVFGDCCWILPKISI